MATPKLVFQGILMLSFIQVSASSQSTHQALNQFVLLFKENGHSMQPLADVRISATLSVDRTEKDTTCLTLRGSATGPASQLQVRVVTI